MSDPFAPGPEASLDDVFELLDDARNDEALALLRRLAEREPEPEPALHALAALVLLTLGRRDEAEAEVTRARRIAPGHPFAEYVHGEVALARGEVREALDAAARVQAALPGDREARLLEARARGRLGEWERAEAVARGVLDEHPQDEEAATVAALAATVRSRGPIPAEEWAALSVRFPANALARAGDGWATLERGDARAARSAFEQALALDPRLGWARAGMLAALKAQHPVYGLLLRYFLWVGRLPPRTQNMLTFGGLLGYNVLRRTARANPELAPWLTPVLVAYAVFVLSTWLADPLFDALVSLRPEGRRVLDDDRRGSAYAVVACLGVALVLGLAAWATSGAGLGAASFGLAASSLAIAAAHQLEPSRRRRLLHGLAALAVLASLAVVAFPEAAGGLLAVALIAAVVSLWVSRFAPAHERRD